MRVSDRQPRIVRAVVDLGDGFVVNVDLDARKVTPAWWNAARADADVSFGTALAQVIVAWDLTEDDGVTVWPPTAENLSKFTFAELGVFVEKMIAASTPSDAEGKASSATPATASSGSTTQPEPLLNGQPTSPSPERSASPSLT